MTIHINTITPNHVITVSDRLLSTPTGHIELGDDRYKHLILICDDARVVTSVAFPNYHINKYSTPPHQESRPFYISI